MIYWRLLPFRVNLSRLQERITRWLAWQMPRSLVMWCFIRIFAHGTQGKYGNTVVPELSAMDALQRWDK